MRETTLPNESGPPMGSRGRNIEVPETIFRADSTGIRALNARAVKLVTKNETVMEPVKMSRFYSIAMRNLMVSLCFSGAIFTSACNNTMPPTTSPNVNSPAPRVAQSIAPQQASPNASGQPGPSGQPRPPAGPEPSGVSHLPPPPSGELRGNGKIVALSKADRTVEVQHNGIPGLTATPGTIKLKIASSTQIGNDIGVGASPDFYFVQEKGEYTITKFGGGNAPAPSTAPSTAPSAAPGAGPAGAPPAGPSGAPSH